MGADEPRDWLDVLVHNGFEQPERWVEFARQHGFRRVSARRLDRCPDCRASARAPLGTFVHYSTLIALQRCRGCDLVYADTRIDPQLIQEHFETAYKDEEYFRSQRRPIFERLAGLVDSLAPEGGRVLDVGGARGDLLAAVRKRRPDLALTLSDVSEQACALAESDHGLRAIRSASADLERLEESFDVVLLIDVAYYEADLPALWRAIDRLVDAGGALVLRIPNRAGWLRASAGLRRLRARLRRRPDAAIPLFNPEHLFAFSRRYLATRLGGLGFQGIGFLPSPALRPRSGWSGIYGALERAAGALHRVSGGALTASPSLLVVARRPARPAANQ